MDDDWGDWGLAPYGGDPHMEVFSAKDGQGRIFLDLPSAPVKLLLDALRMRQLRQLRQLRPSHESGTLQLRPGGSGEFGHTKWDPKIAKLVYNPK